MHDEAVNIDQIVDYKTEYSKVIKKAEFKGDQVLGLCPFHNDTKSSFSANTKTGLYTCFACGAEGNYTKFVAETRGLSTKDAYKQILQEYGIESATKEEIQAIKSAYSLKEYSFEKKIPEEWLKGIGMSADKDKDGTGYIKISYYDEAGKLATYRKRYPKTAATRFKWKFGTKGMLYGLWRMNDVQKAQYVILPEGESDTQTLWYLGFSALGVPGAKHFKSDWVYKLKDIPSIYLHVEPDVGGETFFQKVVEALKEADYEGKVYVLRCKAFGVKDPSDLYIKYGEEDAKRKIHQLIKDAKPIDLEKASVVPEAVKGAPVNLRHPEDYIYNEDGIWRITTEGEFRRICRTPIILTKRLKSLESGEEKIEIAFKRDGKWKTAIYPRSTVFQSKSIVVLADLGCTITSENAKAVVKYLEALEGENIEIIERFESTSSFGWLTGNRFLPGHGKDVVLDIDPSTKNWAAAYVMNGTLEGWLETMREHRERDKFRFILSASFTAPLLRILQQRIFFVYNWGGSKGGKTAATKAAVSAWGDPERLMVNFNATQVGLEKTASFFCDLPLAIDERQLAGNKQEYIEKIVYMLASGTGRIRGSKGGGLQALNTWRTVVLSTGEEPLSTETSQTGVSTRVLEIYGGPFNDEISASKMHRESGNNCGWAGPEFVGKLLEIDEILLKEKHSKFSDYLYNMSDGRSVAHISGVAAVTLADSLLSQWLYKIPEDEAEKRAIKMAETIIKEQSTSQSADVNENATQFIVDWILSNKSQFGERVYGTCYGMLMNGKAYLFPSLFNQVLQKAGYSAKKTIKYLADNGFISCSTNGNHKTYTITKRFECRVCRFIEFQLNKFVVEDDPLLDEESMAEKVAAEKGNNGFVQVGVNDIIPFDEPLPF